MNNRVHCIKCVCERVCVSVSTAVCLHVLSLHAELIIYSNAALVKPEDDDLTVCLWT